MLALIYTRVSLDQAEGRSVREQEAEARRVCEREGWAVARVVTDSVGASRHSKGKRSGWDEVRATLERGEVQVLVTWEASRAQRDLMAYAELRDLCAKTGTLWSYSGRTHDLTQSHDRFTTGLDALLAEREADQIAERVQRAVRANAAAGRPHGRRLFGYRRLYDPTTGQPSGQEPEPDEAAIVRRMFDSSLAGHGIDAIARSLNAEGLTTAKGSPWSYQGVARMLRNPGYAGRRVHQGEVIGTAQWEPIIEPERFDAVQEQLDVRRGHRSANRPRLLTGVARCGVCGSGRVGVIGGPRHVRKYVCRDHHCFARDAEKLEYYVSRRVLGRLEGIDHLDPADPYDEAAPLRAELAELQERLDQAADEYSRGDLSARTLARIERTLTAEMAAVRARLRRLSLPRQLDLPTGDVAEWWNALTDEQRRDYVNALIDVLVIHRTGRGRRTFDPDAVEVVWR